MKTRSYHSVANILAALAVSAILAASPAIAADEQADAAPADAAAAGDNDSIVVTGRLVEATKTAEC